MKLSTSDSNIKRQGKYTSRHSTLSHLVDNNPNARLDPENAGWEFRYNVFELLPKLFSEDIIKYVKFFQGKMALGLTLTYNNPSHNS